MNADNGTVIGSDENQIVEKSVETKTLPMSIIFQCIKCNTIVGDTSTLVHTNQEHQTLTLTGVSNIMWSTSVDTSISGYDVGNTYFTFSCKHCEVAKC